MLLFFEGTEKVQRNCLTKIFPNVQVNFLAQLASKPLFYWIMTSENSLVLLVRFFGFVAPFWVLSKIARFEITERSAKSQPDHL